VWRRSRTRHLRGRAFALAGFMVEVRFGGIFADLFIAAASAILVVPVRQVGWACMHDALAFALLNAEIRSRRHTVGGGESALTAAGVRVEERLVLGTDCCLTSALA